MREMSPGRNELDTGPLNCDAVGEVRSTSASGAMSIRSGAEFGCRPMASDAACGRQKATCRAVRGRLWPDMKHVTSGLRQQVSES